MQIIRGNYESTRTIQAKRSQVHKRKVSRPNHLDTIRQVVFTAMVVLVAFALYWFAAVAAYALS
jgi:hypothetical protein